MYVPACSSNDSSVRFQCQSITLRPYTRRPQNLMPLLLILPLLLPLGTARPGQASAHPPSASGSSAAAPHAAPSRRRRAPHATQHYVHHHHHLLPLQARAPRVPWRQPLRPPAAAVGPAAVVHHRRPAGAAPGRPTAPCSAAGTAPRTAARVCRTKPADPAAGRPAEQQHACMRLTTAAMESVCDVPAHCSKAGSAGVEDPWYCRPLHATQIAHSSSAPPMMQAIPSSCPVGLTCSTKLRLAAIGPPPPRTPDPRTLQHPKLYSKRKCRRLPPLPPPPPPKKKGWRMA